MDLYLKKAKLVLFVDSLKAARVDLGKCTDLTGLFMSEGRKGIMDKVSKMESGWLYAQKDVMDELTIKQIAYYCDGYVEYYLNPSIDKVELMYWFKTSSTKVVHSPPPRNVLVREDKVGSDRVSSEGLELLEERHAREKDKVELHFGSGQVAAAGFDSDDPDADLDI